MKTSTIGNRERRVPETPVEVEELRVEVAQRRLRKARAELARVLAAGRWPYALRRYEEQVRLCEAHVARMKERLAAARAAQ